MVGGEAFLVVGLGCLAAVAGAVIAVVALSRARRQREAPVPPPASVDPFQTGDTDALRGDPAR
ncbi:hypothetical protein Phou_003700 [Phytohabitans houttuyneae]|uniref:Uncharacterized protein n=1 Tax=Phytohabitans houttuyneae TaxID=1076126 RepID=A0A6V8JY21_9ACTN|nr:hypothetical protein Phou_003700 [Phytohabitans houttuyneae]